MVSPQMKLVLAGKLKPSTKHNLDFDSLPVGSSFEISCDQISLPVLRASMYRAAKRLNRKFAIVRLADTNMYEVGRFPDDGKPIQYEEDIRPPQSFFTSPAVAQVTPKFFESPVEELRDYVYDENLSPEQNEAEKAYEQSQGWCK